MSDYISREAFIADMEKRYCEPCKAEGKDHSRTWCRACWVDDMLYEIEGAPAADVAPVVHGEWIEDESGYQICSNCGDEHYWDEYRAAYCESCGAKMGGKS